MNTTTLSKHKSEFLQRIGAYITLIRRKRSLKQIEFASSIGVTQAALSKYENGQINIPILSLKTISDKYDVGITDFFVTGEKPSVLFKRMLKAPEKPTKEDAMFDEYISKPENTDKAILLEDASYIISSGVLDDNDELRDKFVYEIERKLTEDSGEQLRRLMAYAKAIHKLHMKQSQSKTTRSS